MPNLLIVKKKINEYKKKVIVGGDKSLSIRWILFSSLASGMSEAKNLLLSEDVLAAITVIKKLGIKVILKKNSCKIYGRGIDGYHYKNNLKIDAENSGTLGRLILGLLINNPKTIKLVGDKSLSQRDFRRVAEPLSKFGVKFNLNNNYGLPLTIKGSKNLKPIQYIEKRGSAQCKSSIIFGGMRTEGKTIIKAKKSRNHTELMCKYLKLPIKIRNKKNHDLIEINKVNNINKLNYKIPSDISSAAFFIVLTVLKKNSEIIIKNVNINPSRIGIITILKKMGVRFIFLNKKFYKGEALADIKVKSTKKLKSINCPSKLISKAIDEFLIIFLVAAKANGVSYFKNLSELNKKESPRLDWAVKILKFIGIKTIRTKDSIRIFGNPKLKVNKKIIIKNFLKDHRVFMTSVIAAHSFGGNWIIHDKDSIKTSFPSFLKVLNKLKK
ncbi:3-phosphoshikimate 1-carboxyvinyltransferase [Candidatus Pelagibacter sp.]|nr:3-phosphoshikimate 1-carboxyvinyltransferase [Candidatus Pelagibacter sp.]